MGVKTGEMGAADWFWCGSIPLGKLCGVSIRLHWSYLAVLATSLACLVAADAKALALITLQVNASVLLFSLLSASLAYAAVARGLGADDSELILWFLGPLPSTWVGTSPLSDLAAILIFAVAFLPHAAAWFAIAVATPISDGMQDFQAAPDPEALAEANPVLTFCLRSIGVNLFLPAWTLLFPAFPLIGSRVMTDILIACGVGKRLVGGLTVGVSLLLSVVMVAFSARQMDPMGLAIASFVMYRSWGLRSAVVADRLEGVPEFSFGRVRLPRAQVHEASCGGGSLEKGVMGGKIIA